MTAPATPSFGAVFAEQLRVVGLKLRPELLAVALALGFITVLFLRAGRFIAAEPETDGLIVLAAFFFSFAVWRGERLFGDGRFWMLPVDRVRHALIRVAAGWAWLMGVGAVTVLWLVMLALVTGGMLAGEETGVLIAASGPQRPLPEGLPTLPPLIQPWQWLAPFGGATALYLLGSAFALGLRHPLRWTVGLFMGLVAFMALVPANVVTDLIQAGAGGPLSLETALTGTRGGHDNETGMVAATFDALLEGSTDLGRWALATLAWVAMGSVALAAAAWRHRER